MLVSVASFLPIAVLAPISDVVGTTTVIFVVSLIIGLSGVASIVRRGPLQPAESRSTADAMVHPVALDPVAVTSGETARAYERTHPRAKSAAPHTVSVSLPGAGPDDTILIQKDDAPHG
jgi:hypothetical protein